MPAFEVAHAHDGNPPVWLLALTECGTHALVDVVFDGCRPRPVSSPGAAAAGLASAPGRHGPVEKPGLGRLSTQRNQVYTR